MSPEKQRATCACDLFCAPGTILYKTLFVIHTNDASIAKPGADVESRYDLQLFETAFVLSSSHHVFDL